MVTVTRITEIGWPNKKWPTHDMGRDMKFDKLSVCPEFKQKKMLYRFMSLEKFKSLMKNRMLFFAKAKKLSDKFEGGHLIPGLENECKNNRDFTYVSCWTQNDPRDYSKLFMWRPQCKNENHIAIGVPIENFFLDESYSYLFRDTIFEKYMGKMGYLNPDKKDYVEKYKTNSFVPFFLKREYFTDENEIRIVIQDIPHKIPADCFESYQILDGKPVPGIPVLIDLNKIDEFIISPIAEQQIVDDIKLCINNAGLNKSNPEKLTKPSGEDLEKATKKVELLDEYNKESLDSYINYNGLKVVIQEYSNQIKQFQDASGNYVGPSAFAYIPENASGSYVGPSVLAIPENSSGGYVLPSVLVSIPENESNNGSITWINQQSQYIKKDKNPTSKVPFNRVTFVCHWLTKSYLMRKL
jgi:hypothetical protein